MKNGFVKALTLFVLAGCVLFIVFIFLVKYVGPQSGGIVNIGNQSGGTSATGIGTAGTNPLLKFLDDTPGIDGGSTFGNSGLGNVPASARSPYAGKVSLSGGSAAYAVQTGDEYLTMNNSSNSSISVTGWTLTNGKGTRPIQYSQNSYVYPVADSATIGQGTEFLDPSGRFSSGSIVLRPGDSAIVTTGLPGASFPFSINTSFRENICQGYLRNYPFTPQLSQMCPLPTNDPLIRTVTDECYDYMNGLIRCMDPEKYDKKRFDAQTSQCKNFMTQRLNYSSCVANNKAASGFSLGQWRIFLNKPKELWASQRETITLYDSRGLIVDQITY